MNNTQFYQHHFCFHFWNFSLFNLKLFFVNFISISKRKRKNVEVMMDFLVRLWSEKWVWNIKFMLYFWKKIFVRVFVSNLWIFYVVAYLGLFDWIEWEKVEFLKSDGCWFGDGEGWFVLDPFLLIFEIISCFWVRSWDIPRINLKSLKKNVKNSNSQNAWHHLKKINPQKVFSNKMTKKSVKNCSYFA